MTDNPIVLDAKAHIKVSISSKPNSLLYIFNTEGEYFSLQRIYKKLDFDFKNLEINTSYFTEQGMLMSRPETKTIFLLDNNFGLIEWCKYY